MSRIGKKPVAMPLGVSAAVEGQSNCSKPEFRIAFLPSQTPCARFFIRRYHPAQLRMHRRAVEALGKILGQQLPVCLHVGDDALAYPEILNSMVFERIGRCESRGSARQANENKSTPGPDRYFVERKILFIEIRCLHAPRRGDEPAFQVVGPRW